MKTNREQMNLLRGRARQGYLLALLFILIGGLFNIYFVVTLPDKPFALLSVNIALLLLCMATIYLKNKNIYKNLKEKESLLYKEQIIRKEEIQDAEVGSGSLYIPFLGDLFPKRWGLPMNKFSKYKICVQSREIDVNKDTYEKLNEKELVTLCYAKHSKVFLGVIVDN